MFGCGPGGAEHVSGEQHRAVGRRAGHQGTHDPQQRTTQQNRYHGHQGRQLFYGGGTDCDPARLMWLNPAGWLLRTSLPTHHARCAPGTVSLLWPIMRKWLAIAAEHLNRWEANVVAATALSADPPDPVVTVLTTVAQGGGLWLAIAAALATRRGRARRAAREGILAVAVASGSCHLIKRWLPRRRPAVDHLPARQALTRKPTSPAFPSAHSATAVAFTTAIACESPTAGLMVAPLAMAVAYSRIRTWAHWPSDVVAGALWGIAVGVAIRRLLQLPTAADSIPNRPFSQV